MTQSPRRVLVIGLDGGTFDLIDPLVEAGELPFLRAMMRDGFRAPLTSVYPPKTIPAWFCLATGLDPGELGVFGFTEPDGGPGRSRLVQTFRPAEAVWDLLSRQGHRVGVLNFPLRAGYPLNGFVVPGMLSEEGPTYPAALKGAIDKALGEPCVTELPPYREPERTTWLATATRGVRQRGRVAAHLATTERPEFLFVLFRETDRVEHQHWAELERDPKHLSQDLLEFWRAVDDSVREIDEAFRSAGGPALTMVVSDHGHGSARADFFTNRWLEQEGFLNFKNGGVGAHRRLMARLFIAADRIPVARSLVKIAAEGARAGARTERVARAIAGEGGFEAMANKIDWKSTRAFSYPVPEGIYVNRYNPDLSSESAASTVAEIRSRLLQYGDAKIRVFEPRKIYRGTNLAQAPALLLEVDGLATELRMDFSYPDVLLRRRPSFFYGTGVHRMHGILLAHGDGVKRSRSSVPLPLLGVAPTVLDVMGAPPPPALSGRSFAGELGLAPP